MNPGTITLSDFLVMGSQKKNYKLTHKVLPVCVSLDLPLQSAASAEQKLPIVLLHGNFMS